jgi:acetyl-CoA carboxylase beta subunit
MTAGAFSKSDPAERIIALLDPGTAKVFARPAGLALATATGMLGGRPVGIAANDRETAGGSFGAAESHALIELLKQCDESGLRLVLCLDSAGARLDEGLPALGAFRQLYRHLLDARFAGLPVLALLGRDCFGGASMLAASSSQRVYALGSRLAMSGPAVIQALGGRSELDASDTQAVTSLMGGVARAGQDLAGRLCEDSGYAFRQAALDWVALPATGGVIDISGMHNQLGIRLLSRGMAPTPRSESNPVLPGIIRELVSESFHAVQTDGVLIGRMAKSLPDTFFGFVSGEPVGALAAWTLAGACLALAQRSPNEAITLLLDSPGQAPTYRDERLLLSDYVAHLALVLTHLRELGHRVTLQVIGQAAGGIYVALAAPATRVVALPGATVQMLPPAAIARVIGRSHDRGNVDDFLRAGVVDTLI